MTNRERAEQIDRDLNLAGGKDIEYLTRALNAAARDAIDSAAKVLADELRLRPTYWTAGHLDESTPLHRLMREIRALVPREGGG